MVCLGDSITQYASQPNGWINLLSERYVREFDFTNRGFSGYNTRWMLEHFSTIENDFKGAELVTILFGANDSCTEVPQNVPVSDFSTNLKELIERIRKLGPKHIVLIETPWVDGPAYLKYVNETYPEKEMNKSTRNEELTGLYAKTVSNVGKEINCPTIPLHEKMKNYSSESDLLSDGLHFGSLGNRILADLIDKFIKDNLKVKTQLPDWKDLS